MIEKLSQEVVNQIAAGEVVERPASVVKELLDNSIDAGAKKIDIKIKSGGKKFIEISDDGIGINKNDLGRVFEAHTTSKIKNLDDLNEIISMGFRGEALSTIVSVANVNMISREKESDFAYKILGEGVKISEPIKYPRDYGTTISVENLFANIPARFKYLRADTTEYRKILEAVLPYFLIYPEIHFTFTNNSKIVYNLPKVGNSHGEVVKARIQSVLKSEFVENMISVSYSGDGIKISGFVAQPRHVSDKTQHQYFFLNKRPIYDRGFVKSVSQGFSGFIASGKKIPFVLSLEISPSLVDVNVHPRKEEVKFMNPYRVYSAVEQAVSGALKTYSKKEINFPESNNEVSTFQDRPRKSKEVNYQKESRYSVESGLEFSQHLLKPKVFKQKDLSLFKEESFDNPCFQVFNKYIVVEFGNEIWIVDQHAASERIHYENLQNALETQSLLVPVEIQLDEMEYSHVKENINVLKEFGFNLQLENSELKVTEVPANLSGSDIEKFFKELLNEEELKEDMLCKREKMLFVIACHASVRSGQKLSEFEMKNILKELKDCENSISCPHGRPIIWKLKIKEIDDKFNRI
jgi:DNA mismatch repair protein MutL